jgi:hypothetical protein
MARHGFALPDATLPAVEAAIASWRALGPGRTAVSSASVVAESAKSLVVRLCTDIADGGPIIAKCAAREVVLREAYLYECLLPAAGIAAPRFVGIGSDRESSLAWLFIDDVGGVGYDPSSPAHAQLVAWWLASVHASLCDGQADAALRLPPHGADMHLARLRQSRVALRQRISRATANSEEFAVLRHGIAVCDQLERRWPQIVALSRILPETLVHGDLAPENVRISEGQVYAFDWEKAGWGTPVVDLARVDLETYTTHAHELWGVSPADVEQAARCGAIFRTLSHKWATKPLRNVALYLRRLNHEMRDAGIAGVPQ